MTIGFKDFIKTLVLEELHPEIKTALYDSSSDTYKSKQSLIASKIKDLSARGESTGLESNMPKGSARAYLKHSEPHSINLDGKPTQIETGTKVAIRSTLDKYHTAEKHDGMHIGQLQNRAENGDSFVDKNYRILVKDSVNEGSYKSNKENGIFPPLIDSDEHNHEWAHVGHVHDIKRSDFPKLTKTDSHPNGITHRDFVNVMDRAHRESIGRHWKGSDAEEKHLDRVQKHPLLENFLDHSANFGNPPHDYHQIKNMGVFHHPDGSKHIVARDHGFDDDVAGAYLAARKKIRNMRFGS